MDNRVKKYDDGKYRWVYELNLKEDKSILNVVIKAVILAIVVPYLLLAGYTYFQGNLQAMRDITPVFALVGIAVIIIAFISYFAVTKYYKGYFTFLYEMDEDGIWFRRIESDKENTETIGKLAAFTGALIGNIGLFASGLNTAGNHDAYSDFKKIYSIKSRPRDHLIVLTSFFLFNYIYVNEEDYNMVLEFIESCTGKSA